MFGEDVSMNERPPPSRPLTGPLLKVCWARGIGGCGGGLSGEHVISDGLFTGSVVGIAGGPWTEGEVRPFGKNKLKRRILCVRHNSALSPVDREGIRTFRGIRDLDEALAANRRRPGGVHLRHEVVGSLLERWFLKTAINSFVVGGGTKTWEGGSVPSDPPLWLVQAAFGHGALPPPLGLYNWSGESVGGKVSLVQEVGFVPLYFEGAILIGARFTFHGLSFLIWFSKAELPWVELRAFHRHVGGRFQDAQSRADLVVRW